MLFSSCFFKSLVDSVNGPFSVHYCKVDLEKNFLLRLLSSHSEETTASFVFWSHIATWTPVPF